MHLGWNFSKISRLDHGHVAAKDAEWPAQFMSREPHETGFENVEFGELRMLGFFNFVVASGHLMLEPEEHIGQAQDQGLNWRVRLEDAGQQTVFYHDQGVVDILVVASLFG